MASKRGLGKKNKNKKGGSKTTITKAKSKRNRKTLKITCPICYEDLGTQSVSATICGHIFCTTCLLNAKKIKLFCPICRASLRGAKAHHPLFLENCLTFE